MAGQPERFQGVGGMRVKVHLMGLGRGQEQGEAGADVRPRWGVCRESAPQQSSGIAGPRPQRG